MKEQVSVVLISTEEYDLNYQKWANLPSTASGSIKITKVSDLQSLIRLISDQSFHLDIAVIDIKKIKDLKKTNIYDVIYSLNTLGLCSTEKTNSGDLKSRDFSVAVGISLNDELSLIEEVIRSDIKGIFPLGKEFADEERKESIENIMNGKHFIPSSIKNILNRHKKRKCNAVPELTERQKQVLSLVRTRGASNKTIARQLNITESTVKLHMSSIFKKYGVRNRTQLALFCQSNNID